MEKDVRCKKNQSLYEAILTSAKNTPNNVAFYYMHHKFLYKHFLKRVNQFASGLISIGVKKDEPVTVCLPNIPDAIYLLYAINQIGAIANLVHPLYTFEQMKENVSLVGSKYLFVLDTNYLTFKPLEQLGINLLACSPTEELTFVEKVVYYAQNKQSLKDIKRTETTHSFYMMNEYRDFDSRFLDDAIFLHSGGTSGKAKTIALSCFAINALAWNGSHLLDLIDTKDRGMLAVLPIFHGFGLCMGIHAMFAHSGTNVLMPKFASKDTIKYIKQNKIHYIIGIPILYQALLNNKSFKGKILKNLDIAFVGGDFVSSSLINAWDERMKSAGSKCRLKEGYGLTETVTVCSANIHKESEEGTVGKPLENVRFMIVDPETMIRKNADEEGELFIAGETLMNGYRFCNESINDEAFYVDKDGVKWVRTGDWCLLKKSGYLVFKQRLKRIIKVNGIPVFPSMIEDCVKQLDFVFEVAAIGVSDEKRGSMVKLFVSLDHHHKVAKDVAINAIEASIIKKLGIYAKPKVIVFMDKLPHTIVGKIDVKLLK